MSFIKDGAGDHREFLNLPAATLVTCRKQNRDKIKDVQQTKEVSFRNLLQDLQYMRELYEDGVLVLSNIKEEFHRELLEKSVELILQGLERHVDLQESLFASAGESFSQSSNTLDPLKVLKQELVECATDPQAASQTDSKQESKDIFKMGNFFNLQDQLDCDPDGNSQDFKDFLNPTDIKLESSDVCDDKDPVVEEDVKPKKRRNRKKGAVITCDKCSMQFTAKCKYTVHMRRHLGEKPFKCDQCPKAFSTKGNLKGHFLSLHNQHRPYECTVCQKRFSLKTDLVRHGLIHTGEKPYKCEFCFKECTTSSNFIRHRRTHTGEKPYSCDVCNKAFTSTAGLTEHKRTHTGERPFQCHVCNSRFARQNHLRRHIRLHSGIKPYQCEICEKCFTRRENLREHMNTHTRIKSEGENLVNNLQMKCDSASIQMKCDSASLHHPDDMSLHDI